MDNKDVSIRLNEEQAKELLVLLDIAIHRSGGTSLNTTYTIIRAKLLDDLDKVFLK